MISWLDDNPAGKVLASVAGGLGVIMLLLALAWSLPPSGSDADGAGDGQSPSGEIPQLEPAGPIDEFAVITERPVFNESRQPVLVLDSDEEEGEEGEELVDVEAPDVELAGVVITPEMRVATLRFRAIDPLRRRWGLPPNRSVTSNASSSTSRSQNWFSRTIVMSSGYVCRREGGNCSSGWLVKNVMRKWCSPGSPSSATRARMSRTTPFRALLTSSG